MFDFISKGIKSRGLDIPTDNSNRDEIDDDMFIEAAHILEELSDLSKDGTEDSSAIRKMSIDIPVEEDLEIDTLEFNTMDGRITDMPMDATSSTLQESYYGRLKTFNDFYEKSEASLTQLPRETDNDFADRVNARAERLYTEYMDTLVQEGAFGFGMIKLSSESIKWDIHLNLGPMKSGESDYNIILPLSYEHENHKIYKKQAETVNYFDYCKFTAFKSGLEDYAESKKIKIPKNGSVWDVIRPEKVYIPIEPKTEYMIIIGLKITTTGEDIYWSFSVPVKDAKARKKNVGIDTNESFVSMPSMSFSKASFTTANTVKSIHESMYPTRFDDEYMYQEAIDFGGGGNPPELNEMNAGANAAAPQVSTGMSDQSMAQPTNAAPMANNEVQPEIPENGNVNDVSEEIANKVNDRLAAQNGDTGEPMDASPDVDLSEAEPDMGDSDFSDIENGPVDEPDMAIPEDDSEIPDVSEEEIGGDADVDNMTIEQLKELAAQRVEGMTINQIKDFLSNNDSVDNTENDIAPEDIQEFVIYTKNNINSSMESLIKTALGILNDESLELPVLIKKFKHNGKKLNKCLTKATTMPIYNDAEKQSISELNKCLLNFMSMVKDNPNDSAIKTVENLVKEFTSLSRRVGDIIDNHKSKPSNG